ncbi:hypothetical protein I4U23_019524 [Adineta vaga]|nr:hypothetical protein I4U23_019524 [Adineta vaga]
MAARNALLWKVRLNVADSSQKQYREFVGNLNTENETLRDQMRQTEKDTLDVISFLKKQDIEKDVEIERLQQEIKDLQVDNVKETDELTNDFKQQKRYLDEKLARKESELDIVRHELNQIKDFRKRKDQMQKELDEIKQAMIYNEREQKESLERQERKFSEEKQRLHQECNKKIEEIAEHAQDEAIKTLDENGRSVFKENVGLIKSLHIYKQELADLQQMREQLIKQASIVTDDKDINDTLMKEKVEQVQKRNKKIKELKEKIQSLEISLTQFIEEFNVERRQLLEQSQIEQESSQNEIIKLQRALELKGKEMNKVKKLGKTILQQRSELENMFLNALQHVKRQIVYERLQYPKIELSPSENRIVTVYQGQEDSTRMATLSEFNTNGAPHGLDEETKWVNQTAELSSTDLTWEQKEQVLRELFIRMNAKKTHMMLDTRSNTEHSIHDDNTGDSTTNVFVTQTDSIIPNESASNSRSNISTSAVPKLPQICHQQSHKLV